MHLSDIKAKHITELGEMAAANQIENANRMRKQDLMLALLKSHAKKGESIFGDGTLEATSSLHEVVVRVRRFLVPVVEALAAGQEWRRNWPVGGPWLEH